MLSAFGLAPLLKCTAADHCSATFQQEQSIRALRSSRNRITLYPAGKTVCLRISLQQDNRLIKKMSGAKEQGGDAQQKFWNNQDLMEKLLPFLDAQSTLSLVQSQFSCTLDILQDPENPSIWIKLVGRSLTSSNPFEGADNLDPDALGATFAMHGALCNLVRANFEKRRAQVVPLIAILKLMKDANPHILNLLEAIIQKYQDDLGIGVIQMTCPCTTELHSVNLVSSSRGGRAGFWLCTARDSFA